MSGITSWKDTLSKTHFRELAQNDCWSSIISYFSFQPVLLDWYNKGRGMYYPVCGMMDIKELLLLIGKSSLCRDSEFPLSLSEWSFTINPKPYNRK